MDAQHNRNSSFEIMRLVAMFMIVMEHGLLATTLNTQPVLSALDNISWFIEAFTICAVDLFFLLSGYFSSSKNNLYKCFSFWKQTFFYSSVIYLIFALWNKSFSVGAAIKFLFPITFQEYWFMQVYILLVLLIPFISDSLDRLMTKQHRILCIILVLFFCVHQTFIPARYTLDETQGYGIIWGICLVVIGNYLRKIQKQILLHSKWIYLFGYVFTAILMFVSNLLIVKFNIASGLDSRANFYAYNSITVLVESLFLFMFFVKLGQRNICNSRINRITSSALSVYLISAHPLLLRYIWTDILKLQNHIPGNAVVFVILCTIYSVAIMCVCIAIDQLAKPIYQALFGRKFCKSN